jgi:hypothetical protein
MKHLSELPTYMIAIKGNEASEYYADYVTPLWNKLDIDIERFDAVTPQTLHEYPLVFGNRQDNNVTTTQTERASTCSHYLLWKKCIEMNERIFVLEHDAYPDPVVGDDFYDVSTYDYYGFAPGNAAYVIDPLFANHLCCILESIVICGGTLAQVHHFSKSPWNVMYDFTKMDFEMKVKQLISRRYGSTSNHSMLYDTTLTFKDGNIDKCGTRNVNRIFEVID